MSNEVTDQVEMGLPDGNDCPIKRCICGAQFGHWDQVMETGRIWGCPNCQVRLELGAYVIRVFKLESDDPRLIFK